MKRAHHDLKVWQEAMALVKMIYENSSCFPESKNFGLKSQIRRAAVSIPSRLPKTKRSYCHEVNKLTASLCFSQLSNFSSLIISCKS
ncbi:MAG: four helix bundle protein [Syntrophobacterales bacterium]|nr:four helix bundle protein [Syntrophobacterales bacterium]